MGPTSYNCPTALRRLRRRAAVIASIRHVQRVPVRAETSPCGAAMRSLQRLKRTRRSDGSRWQRVTLDHSYPRNGYDHSRIGGLRCRLEFGRIDHVSSRTPRSR
jgi:hypothetical protein